MSSYQPSFAAALLDPKLPTPKGLCNPDGAPASKRFDVYRNNVTHSLMSAMGDAFPVIKKITGDAFFEAAAILYLRDNPPKTPMLMFYGAGFDRFLAEFEPAQTMPYLPDVAAYELHRRSIYHAAHVDPIAPDLLASMDEPTLLAAQFAFAPALHLEAYDSPVQSIWHHNMVDANFKITNPCETVLICRPELDLISLILDPATACFIERLMQHQTLNSAIEQASAINPEFDLGSALGLLLQHNLVTDYLT